MTAFIDRLRSRPPLVWLDATAYAARLLARGQVPWLEPGAYVAWQRKTQLLLDSDVIGVPLASLGEAWLQSHPDLRAAMAAKRRPTHPLRTLLGDGQLRLHAAGLIRDLRTMFAHRILALVIPAPGAWVAAAHAQAHCTDGLLTVDNAVDADAAESAAVYVADFLRAFADGALDVLLMQETTTARHSALDDAAYLPIANLAAHYRWDLGLHSTVAVTSVPSGVSFVIAPPPIVLANSCVPIPADFWSGDYWMGKAPLTGSFVFAEIPAGAEPERVLERLGLLREAENG